MGRSEETNKQLCFVQWEWINVHVGSLLGQSCLVPDIFTLTAVVTASSYGLMGLAVGDRRWGFSPDSRGLNIYNYL